MQLAEGNAEKTIAPSQGIHLVVEKHYFKGNAGMMIPKTDDGRVLFAIPWHDKLLLGTTDTPVEQISIEPKPLKEEIDFIIDHFNRYTTSVIYYKDVLSVFVGLRPLAKMNGKKKTALLPRDHVIKVLPSGLVHVTGGKWTTYRSMAEHTINKAIQTAGLKFISSKTKHLKIHAMYPYTKAEIKWFVEKEMALTVEDILGRRLRLLFLDAKAAIEAAPLVAKMLTALTGKDAQWEQQQLEAFNKLAKGYLINL